MPLELFCWFYENTYVFLSTTFGSIVSSVGLGSAIAAGINVKFQKRKYLHAIKYEAVLAIKTAILAFNKHNLAFNKYTLDHKAILEKVLRQAYKEKKFRIYKLLEDSDKEDFASHVAHELEKECSKFRELNHSYYCLAYEINTNLDFLNNFFAEEQREEIEAMRKSMYSTARNLRMYFLLSAIESNQDEIGKILAIKKSALTAKLVEYVNRKFW